MSIEIKGVVFEDENAPEALKAKVALLEEEKNGLVEEIKGDRTKNREAIEKVTGELDVVKDALKQATEKSTKTPEEDKIAQVVAAELLKRESTRAVSDRKAAFDTFVNEHKEFHPDNDPGGIKRSALEKELNGLTAWVNPVVGENFTAVIGKANALLQGTDTSRQTNMSQSSSMPISPAGVKDVPTDKLSQQERTLIERTGMTEESYLKLKAKMPDYVEGLISQMRS